MDDETIRCENCGNYYPRSEMRRCAHCGAVLCPLCREVHSCLPHTESPVKPKKPKFPRKPAAAAVVILGIFLAALVLVFCIPGVSENIQTLPVIRDAVSFLEPNPHIVLDYAVSGVVTSTAEFSGKSSTETITAHADASVYSGSKNDDSNRIYADDLSYYERMTNDKRLEPFYTDLLNQFYQISEVRNLTSDEFVELVTSYVQSLEYDGNATAIPRYPVRTAIEKSGDCDEKSMLLAGLLSRAGYDVSLLSFGPESHMTVGIRTDDNSAYPETGGYAVIETTGTNVFVTERGTLKGDINLTSIPKVIRIGDGLTKYTAGLQVSAVTAYIRELSQMLGKDSADIDSSFEESQDGYAEYLRKADEINSVAEELKKYNSMIDVSNNKLAHLNLQYSSGSMDYSSYVQMFNAEERIIQQTAALYDAAYENYSSLKRQADDLWDAYQSFYLDYSGKISDYNSYVVLYNQLNRAGVCDRESMYQTILQNPL